MTALMLAAAGGHLEVATLLLAKGAAIDSCNIFNTDALMLACWKGHVELVKLLLDHGAAIDARGDRGTTPLMWAASEGHADIVKLLIARGARLDLRDDNGKTAAQLAEDNNHPLAAFWNHPTEDPNHPPQFLPCNRSPSRRLPKLSKPVTAMRGPLSCARARRDDSMRSGAWSRRVPMSRLIRVVLHRCNGPVAKGSLRR